MNKAGEIIAMVAGVFAIIGAIVTLMVGGLAFQVPTFRRSESALAGWAA